MSERQSSAIICSCSASSSSDQQKLATRIRISANHGTGLWTEASMSPMSKSKTLEAVNLVRCDKKCRDKDQR